MVDIVAVSWKTCLIQGASAGGVLFAVTADGFLAAVGVFSVAFSAALIRMAPAIARAIREIGPAVVDFRGSMRRMIAENDERSRKNEAELEIMRTRNKLLEKLVARQYRTTAGLQQDLAGLGEATLIQNGDLTDPVKGKASS